MKSWKFKILTPIIFLGLLVVAKYILWDFPVSDGRRVGNLTKITHKGKFWVTKTWEGTIDEGSGDKLTTHFSVSSDKIGQELYAYEGKQVILYYNEHFLGWPRDTKYDIVKWKPKDKPVEQQEEKTSDLEMLGSGNPVVDMLSRTLFCSFLGSLYKNQDLYNQVKEYMRENNLYIFNQYEKCND